MYLVKTPSFIRSLFPLYTWKIDSEEKVLYLTFDDGPVPGITDWVLDLLSKYNAKATFFCVGENVDKNPDLFNRIKEEGHEVGNHTYNHLNGWGTENLTYFHNIRKCARLVHSGLFRPPYGRLMPKQRQFLLRHYEIVMWDVLSGDFDEEISKEKCLNNVLVKSGPGSIVVFHDSVKAMEKLKFALPNVLDHFAQAGYRFEKITEGLIADNQKELSRIA